MALKRYTQEQNKQRTEKQDVQTGPKSNYGFWCLVSGVISWIEVSVLEDKATGSVTSALHEILATQGWKSKRISLHPGSSLVPAVKRTSEELMELEGPEEAKEGEEGNDAEQAAALVTSLRQERFEIRTPYATLSRRQAKVESTIRTFKCFLRPPKCQEPLL